MDPVAGWYPDPVGGAHLRYWDGGAWSDQTRIPESKMAPAAGGAEPLSDYYLAPRPAEAQPFARPGSAPGPSARSAATGRGAGHYLRLGYLGYRMVSLALVVLAALGYGGYRWFGSGSGSGSKNVHLATPATIGALTLDVQRTTQQSLSAAQQLSTYGVPTVGVYDDAEANASAYVVAVRSSGNNDATLNGYLPGLNNGGSTAPNFGSFTSVDPGRLGGKMSCAPTTISAVTWTACSFSDAGAFGAIMVATGGSSGIDTARQIREAVETPA